MKTLDIGLPPEPNAETAMKCPCKGCDELIDPAGVLFLGEDLPEPEPVNVEMPPDEDQTASDC